MLIKKNILFIGVLMITTLLITGCDWFGCCKRSCNKNTNKEIIILESNEPNKEEPISIEEKNADSNDDDNAK